MPLPRPAALRGSMRSFSFKRAGNQARSSLRGASRRTYASEHGAQKSSDLPWMIGSVVFTVPAAGWLLQQGPTKSDHGHGHAEEEHEIAPAEDPEEEQPTKEEGDEESEEKPKEESEDKGDQEETKDEAKEEDTEEAKDEAKDEGKDDGKVEDKQEDKDGGKDESKDQGGNKDKEVSNKGKAKTESKGEKDAQGDVSGANNPFMGDNERSKKPEGMVATAKLHGTVDKSDRPAKGHHEPGQKDD